MFFINQTEIFSANIYPILIKADLGTEAQFMCSASESYWSFSPNDTLEDIRIFKGAFFNIEKVQLKDDGYYFCIGEDLDTKRLFTSRAQLKVYGKLLELSLKNLIIPISSIGGSREFLTLFQN